MQLTVGITAGDCSRVKPAATAEPQLAPANALRSSRLPARLLERNTCHHWEYLARQCAATDWHDYCVLLCAAVAPTNRAFPSHAIGHATGGITLHLTIVLDDSQPAALALSHSRQD